MARDREGLHDVEPANSAWPSGVAKASPARVPAARMAIRWIVSSGSGRRTKRTVSGTHARAEHRPR